MVIPEYLNTFRNRKIYKKNYQSAWKIWKTKKNDNEYYFVY